ncbi:putative Box C/D snoRNA protein 1 [Nannochloris sp. 'desiccata']|nr:putative Box C/D snoRNA protein 1 [Chlorella desiccata (nom. nud.)]
MSAPNAEKQSAGANLEEGSEKSASLCVVCNEKLSKYCCPRCDQKTCSLDCVKQHKETTGCSGKRDRTAFVGRGDLDERSLMSDYKFLEQVKLAEDVAKRAKPPAPRAELPHFLQSLVHQARRRGVQLHLLSPGMERRRSNTTRYDNKAQIVSWRIEWNFVGASCSAANARVSEQSKLRDILAAHLTPPHGAALKTPELQKYADCGIDNLTVVMRKERTPANAVLYYKIHITERMLGEVLQGKVIIEYPVLLVLLPEEVGGYTLIEEKEDVQKEDIAEEQEELDGQEDEGAGRGDLAA